MARTSASQAVIDAGGDVLQFAQALLAVSGWQAVQLPLQVEVQKRPGLYARS
jgi:hypothetical protein